MATESSDGNTHRGKRTAKIRFVEREREYPLVPLTDDEVCLAKETILRARDRIRDNGGDTRPSAMNRHATRSGTKWASERLKPNARWSYNDVDHLVEAIVQCELERTTKALCRERGGVSAEELRRRYNEERNAHIAKASKRTGEIVGGEHVTQGGPIPPEYDQWIESKSDTLTLQDLRNMRHSLSMRQLITNAKPDPEYSCAILYEADAAAHIAATLAAYLVDQGVVAGAGMKPYDRAYAVLIKLFAGGHEDGMAPFRDRCEWSFFSHLGRWDVSETNAIRLRIQALRRIDDQEADWTAPLRHPKGALASPAVEQRIREAQTAEEQ